METNNGDGGAVLFLLCVIFPPLGAAVLGFFVVVFAVWLIGMGIVLLGKALQAMFDTVDHLIASTRNSQTEIL